MPRAASAHSGSDTVSPSDGDTGIACCEGGRAASAFRKTTRKWPSKTAQAPRRTRHGAREHGSVGFAATLVGGQGVHRSAQREATGDAAWPHPGTLRGERGGVRSVPLTRRVTDAESKAGKGVHRSTDGRRREPPWGGVDG